jgi:hypothetical protein
MNQEQKDRILKLVKEREFEINLLLTEGHISTSHSKKILNKGKKLLRKIENPLFDLREVISKYPELCFNNKFLYHPDYRKERMELLALMK